MKQMSNYIIIILLVIIVALLVVLILKSRQKTEQTDIINSPAPLDNGDETMKELSQASNFFLNNALGQELAFSRVNELPNSSYKEIRIDKSGNVAQHTAQGTLPVIERVATVNSINSDFAEYGLFTSQIPKNQLSQYKVDGSYSSIQWADKIKSHKGFVEVNLDAYKAASTLALTNIAMQGMAIVSGQYYLKQITTSLQHIEEGVANIINILKREKIGILTNCRKQIQAISRKNVCDEADINSLRIIQDDAGKVLEEYKLHYEKAYNRVLQFQYKGGVGRSALADYNEEISRMRESLGVCMIADRIISEAKLAEIVVRGKINYADPTIPDLMQDLEEQCKNGFNGTMRSNMQDATAPILEKANRIYDKSLEGSLLSNNEESRRKRLNQIKDNVLDLKKETVEISEGIFGKEDDSKQDVYLMIDKGTGESRMYIPVDEQ